MQTITAIFENGVLRPSTALNLPDDAQVRISIEPLESEIQIEWDAKREQRLEAIESLFRMAKVHSGEHLTRDQLHERR